MPMTREQLEEECDRLRAEVALLRDAIGVTAKTVPYAFGLTGQQSQILGLLMEREIVSTDVAGSVLWSGRPDEHSNSRALAAVQLVHVRRKVRSFGVVIHCKYGIGHYLRPEDKQRVRDILEREKAAGADHDMFLVPADHSSNASRPTLSGSGRGRGAESKTSLPFGFTPAEHIVWQELMEMEYVGDRTSRARSPINRRYICHVVQTMRRKLQPFGLEIRNETRRGYFMTSPHKTRAMALLKIVRAA